MEHRSCLSIQGPHPVCAWEFCMCVCLCLCVLYRADGTPAGASRKLNGSLFPSASFSNRLHPSIGQWQKQASHLYRWLACWGPEEAWGRGGGESTPRNWGRPVGLPRVSLTACVTLGKLISLCNHSAFSGNRIILMSLSSGYYEDS